MSQEVVLDSCVSISFINWYFYFHSFYLPLNSFRGERIRREIFTPLLSKSKKEVISLPLMKKNLKNFRRSNSSRGKITSKCCCCSICYCSYLLLLVWKNSTRGCGEFLLHHTEIDKELEENNFILKKEGFFIPFVVLILRCRKIEKD